MSEKTVEEMILRRDDYVPGLVVSLDLFLFCLSQPGKSKTSVVVGCPRRGPLEDASVRQR